MRSTQHARSDVWKDEVTVTHFDEGQRVSRARLRVSCICMSLVVVVHDVHMFAVPKRDSLWVVDEAFRVDHGCKRQVSAVSAECRERASVMRGWRGARDATLTRGWRSF